jgi:hypothetical protein
MEPKGQMLSCICPVLHSSVFFSELDDGGFRVMMNNNWVHSCGLALKLIGEFHRALFLCLRGEEQERV